MWGGKVGITKRNYIEVDLNSLTHKVGKVSELGKMDLFSPNYCYFSS